MSRHARPLHEDSRIRFFFYCALFGVLACGAVLLGVSIWWAFLAGCAIGIPEGIWTGYRAYRRENPKRVGPPMEWII